MLLRNSLQLWDPGGVADGSKDLGVGALGELDHETEADPAVGAGDCALVSVKTVAA